MGRVLDGGGVMSGRGGRRPGSGAKRALADWEADELLMMRRRGARVAEIASRFSLSERSVYRYLRRGRGGDAR